ncbi:MAG: MerR family transcriptional regulator [Candidatus Accumulibacter sp.]|nr:MerR family transcriptional regulator [Accumulibacter sp.]
MSSLTFNIAAVERDTGLSKDVLRVWERRYGFPSPERDANGERCYPTEQVERLCLIKRLMDQGHRPGKLLGLPVDALNQLTPRRHAARERTPAQADLAELLALLRQHDAVGYQRALQQRLARQGLQRFVQDTVAPLTELVGVAWEEGRFEVFEEHLFTELTKRLLRQAISTLPAGRGPRLLLTSVPNEEHVLGLLMVEALFVLEGVECIPLGTQMPLHDIARAAAAHAADIVALSFSVAFPPRQIPGLLQQLRQTLPAGIELWAGGGGTVRLSPPAGVRLLPGFADALDALAEWRARRS